MLNAIKLPLYKAYKTIFFPSVNPGADSTAPYQIDCIIDNNDLLLQSIWLDLNLKLSLHRFISVLPTYPVRYPINQYLFSYKKLGLFPYQFNNINQINNQPVFIDCSYAENIIRNKYIKTNNYRSERAINLTKPLFYINKNKTNCLLYIIDRTKPFPLSIFYKPLMVWLNGMRTKKDIIPYDYVFLCILPGPYYIKIYDKDHQFSFSRILGILHKVKPQSKDAQLETITNEVIANVGLSPKYKQIVQDLLTTYPSLTQAFLNGKVTPTQLVAAAVEYKISGDKNKVVSVINSSKPITAPDVKKLVDKYSDLIIVRNISIAKPSDPVLSTVNTRSVVNYKDGHQLFEFESQDYSVNLQRDLENIAKSVGTGRYPLRVKDIKYEPIENYNDVKRSDLVNVYITFIDNKGKEQQVKLIIPRLRENSFVINDKVYTIVNQLTIVPIFFLRPYIGKLTTTYSTLSISYKFPHKSNGYFQVFIGGYKLELGPAYTYTFGLANTLKLFGISGEFNDIKPSTRELNKQNKEVFVIGNKFLIIDRDKINEYQRALLKSFDRVPYSSITNLHSKDINKQIFWGDVIIHQTNNQNSPFIINQVWTHILDNATLDVLKARGEPTTIPQIVLYICKRIIDPSNVDTRNDLSKQRIRNAEIINQYIFKALSRAYSNYVTQRSMGDENAQLEVNAAHVLREILSDPNVQVLEHVNPLEELSVKTRLSPTGLGGLPTKEAITVEYRNIHRSYYGAIDPTDTPEGSAVGAIQHLALDSSLHTRGLIGQKPLNDNIGSGMLSVSSAMVPFINSNDGARCMFSANQMRSAVPLLENDIPLVQSGYESILTNYLSRDFIKRSPCNGTVVAITDRSIAIQCDNNKKQIQHVSIEPAQLQSGQGKHGYSNFRPLVKPGQRLKQDQVIAEGANINHGLICMGVNCLTAIMPYKGYNYEDAIVISEELVENKKMTSVHYDQVVVQLPDNSKLLEIVQPGQDIIEGQSLIKFIPPNLAEFIQNIEGIDIDDISANAINIRSEAQGKVFRIDCFGPASTPTQYPELKLIYESFKAYYKQKYPNRQFPRRFTWAGKPFDGIILRFHIKYEVDIAVGDKLCNRHGNKGTVGLILPKDKMPITPFGPAQVLLNPLGIISRMNVGQIKELYCGLLSKQVSIRILDMTQLQALKLLKQLCVILSDNNPDAPMMKLYNGLKSMSVKKWQELLAQIRSGKYAIPILAPPFNSPSTKSIINALKLLGLRTKYYLTLPEEDGIKTKRPVPVGYMYMLKLEHIAKWKLSARSTKAYISKTLQPPRGKKKEGGQRLGELETWGMLSYGASHVFSEMFGSLSDDHTTKMQITQDIIKNGSAKYRKPISKPTRDAFLALLAGIHIKPF